MANLIHYQAFADVLRYPETRLEPFLDKLLTVLENKFPGKTFAINQMLYDLSGMSLGAQQEYYMKTFDVQAICTLDMGYLLFGEDYKRAQILVNLQQEHQKAKIDCRGELADHLPNILELLSVSQDYDFTEELGFIILNPAVKFMQVKMKNTNNYYKFILEDLLCCLEDDFAGENLTEFKVPEQLLQENNEFLFPAPKNIICDIGCKYKS